MQGIKIGDYRHKMCCTITAGENGTRQALVRVVVCRHSFHCPCCLARQELCHVPFYPHYHYYHGQICPWSWTSCSEHTSKTLVCSEQDVQLHGGTGQSAEPRCVYVWLLLLLWSFHCCAQNGMSNSMAGLASQQSSTPDDQASEKKKRKRVSVGVE